MFYRFHVYISYASDFYTRFDSAGAAAAKAPFPKRYIKKVSFVNTYILRVVLFSQKEKKNLPLLVLL